MSKLVFKIEQIAIVPVNSIAARQLLAEIGHENGWVVDNVQAFGEVRGLECANEAQLQFNYDLLPGGEFEILKYSQGRNWMEGKWPSVSHLGMHVTADELQEWREFFESRDIQVAQEVLTTNHTNPTIAGKRWYNYVIFNTRPTLGVDLKFIVRKEAPPEGF